MGSLSSRQLMKAFLSSSVHDSNHCVHNRSWHSKMLGSRSFTCETDRHNVTCVCRTTKHLTFWFCIVIIADRIASNHYVINIALWWTSMSKVSTCIVVSCSSRLHTFPGTALFIRSSRNCCLWIAPQLRNQLNTQRCSWRVTNETGDTLPDPDPRGVHAKSTKEGGLKSGGAFGKSAEDGGDE